MSDVIVLLHGWPGTRQDWAAVCPLLGGAAVLAPDLLGFGEGFTGPVSAEDATASSHAACVLAMLDEHGCDRAIVAGYDIGSRIAQAMARAAPERVAGLVLTPAFPSLAGHARKPTAQAEYWYQHFHRLELSETLIDGQRDAVAAYLTYFWRHWSGDRRGPSAGVIDAYARPGAFTASVTWYAANAYADAAPLDTPTVVLWGDCDPLFPIEWAGAVPGSFTQAELRRLNGIGHFVPLEAPVAMATAIRDLRSRIHS